MQVKRLIELLSALDPEAHVFVGSTSADAMLGDVTAPYDGAVKLLADYDFVEAEMDAGWQTGHDEGYAEGSREGYAEGSSESYGKGYDDGYDVAYADGYNVGVKEAADGAYRRGYDRGFKDYPDHEYDPTPTV